VRARHLLVSGTVAAICAYGFWELAQQVTSDSGLRAWDIVISGAIASLRVPWLTWMMRAVTQMGGTVFVSLVAVGLVVWHATNDRKADAWFTATVIVGGTAVATVAKVQFARVRPPAPDALVTLPQSFSFPSGHTMASLCLAAAIIFAAMRSTTDRSAKVTSILLTAGYALAVGVSRVYLGVHHPSDVLASWLLGATVVSLCLGALAATRRSKEVWPS
jgi:undecaprenyl-diphosphatase